MKIIKAMVFVLSVGWPMIITAYGFRASLTEMLILFAGLTCITFIFAKKGE